jgi:hypothetical protein
LPTNTDIIATSLKEQLPVDLDWCKPQSIDYRSTSLARHIYSRDIFTRNAIRDEDFGAPCLALCLVNDGVGVCPVRRKYHLGIEKREAGKRKVKSDTIGSSVLISNESTVQIENCLAYAQNAEVLMVTIPAPHKHHWIARVDIEIRIAMKSSLRSVPERYVHASTTVLNLLIRYRSVRDSGAALMRQNSMSENRSQIAYRLYVVKL